MLKNISGQSKSEEIKQLSVMMVTGRLSEVLTEFSSYYTPLVL